jgi:predicted phosphoribosyltransferase
VQVSNDGVEHGRRSSKRHSDARRARGGTRDAPLVTVLPFFRDRADAGRHLARRLVPFAGVPDTVVLGLPRGGAPVAFEIAKALRVPLDAYVVRKLGVPGHEELAMGAIASGGVRVVNPDVIELLGIEPEVIEGVAARETQELERREQMYRDARGPLDMRGRTAIVVDDGLATGSTMRAAIRALQRSGAKHIVVAVPVAARSTADDIATEADELLCAVVPEPFHAVSLWYEDFEPVSDDEVRALLDRARREIGAPEAAREEQARHA